MFVLPLKKKNENYHKKLSESSRHFISQRTNMRSAEHTNRPRVESLDRVLHSSDMKIRPKNKLLFSAGKSSDQMILNHLTTTQEKFLPKTSRLLDSNSTQMNSAKFVMTRRKSNETWDLTEKYQTINAKIK